jgi:hypothetical protein
MIDAVRLLFLIVISLLGFITYTLMHSELYENDVKPSLFLRHIGSIVDFIYLTKGATDDGKKSYYRRLLWGLFLSIILFIGTGLTFLVYPWRH